MIMMEFVIPNALLCNVLFNINMQEIHHCMSFFNYYRKIIPRTKY